MGSTVPLGIYHTNHEETIVNNYRIPKRSIMVANTYAMHRDPQFWENPDIFRPERFLDNSGKIKSSKGYMPFYTGKTLLIVRVKQESNDRLLRLLSGKRSCLAEHFAKTVVFLLFANIMNRYDVKRPDEANPTSKDCSSGLIRSPLPYRVRMDLSGEKLITETQVRSA